LSDEEFEEIAGMFGALGIPVDFFIHEDGFIQHVLQQETRYNKKSIVYNAAQSGTGPGRKALIPSFCNMHGLVCTGSNAYVVSLCRHKYHVNKLLQQSGIPVPDSWLYYHGWLHNCSPPFGQKVIVKPIYESASIGIDNNSVFVFDSNTETMLKERALIHRQPVIVQEFIKGYEAEVPLVIAEKDTISFDAVGISVNGKTLLNELFLDYDKIYFDKYAFFNLNEEWKGSDVLLPCAESVADLLGMTGLCRVDFRIQEDGRYFVTDVSTNPHFVRHSSIGYAFRKLGYEAIHIAKTILGSALIGK
jgi:D-alanine-D-alanine ligase